jgi:16S rRNA (cytidine1402-2'-O)-methyltransferase
MSAESDAQVAGGALYVVATPIGNLGDLTPRALNVLRQADVLAAEDTRVLRKLGSANGVGTGSRLTSLHDHNERSRTAWIVSQLHAGRSVGLFCDAGTPLVSDPGFFVVQAVAAAGLPVVPVPGASALLCALTLAALPTDSFRFCGFLPRQKGKRIAAVEALSSATATLVFYEAQQRVLAAIADMLVVFGDRPAAACCDLTKRGERVCRGPLSAIAAELNDQAPLSGEWVLVIGGAPAAVDVGFPIEADRLIATLLGRGMGVREVRDVTCEAFGTHKKQTYQRVLAQRPEPPMAELDG